MKQTKLFGITMDRKVKIRIVLCSILSVLCLVSYIVLGFFTVPVVEAVYLPSGGLSQSVFDSQNLTYEEVEGYSVKNAFQNIPYTINTVDGPKASVGYGNTYKHAPYYFYFSEVEQGGMLEDVLKAELTDVLMLSAEPDDTVVTVLSEENGYINGCSAVFNVVELTTTKEEMQATAYLCLYRLHLNESIYLTQWDMLVGCMTEAAYSTENLANLEILAKNAISTLKIDKEMEEKLKKETSGT